MADIETGVKNLVAHELTIKQYRDLLQAAAAKAKSDMAQAQAQLDAIKNGGEIPDIPADPIQYLLDDISLDEIILICRCKPADLEELTASELAAVADKCKEANALFFAKREAQKSDNSSAEWLKENPELINQFLSKSGGSKDQPQH